MSILKSIFATATGIGSTALSWLGGVKVWLLIIALSCATTGALGWYGASTHYARIYAEAGAKAAEKARTEQSQKDGRDWAAAKADYEARLHIAQGANDALAGLLDKKSKLVPNPTKAFASADAMRALNDPKLVGETQ